MPPKRVARPYYILWCERWCGEVQRASSPEYLEAAWETIAGHDEVIALVVPSLAAGGE